MEASTTTLLTTKRRELLSLDTQKKGLEIEAEAIVSELTATLPEGGPPIGIDTPLVDNEGYPRADIDVFRARTLRKRFIEIQNDYKALTGTIERKLVEFQTLMKSNEHDDEERALRTAAKPKPKFDPITGQWVVKSWDGSVAGIENGNARQFDDLTAGTDSDMANALVGNASIESRVTGGSISNNTNSTNNNAVGTTSSVQQPTQILEPFALIDQVFPNSPASLAGLCVNDLLLQFDSITARNHENFTAIAELLPNKEGKEVSVKVRRMRAMEWGEVSEIIELRLKPKKWEGRGLLGCHIAKV